MCTLKTLAKFCVQNKRLNENARLLCSFGLVQHAISSQWWTVYLLKYWTLLSFAGEDPNAKTPRQAGKKTGVSFDEVNCHPKNKTGRQQKQKKQAGANKRTK